MTAPACPTCGWPGISPSVPICVEHLSAPSPPDAMAEVERLVDALVTNAHDEGLELGAGRDDLMDEARSRTDLARTALLDFVRPYLGEPDYEAAARLIASIPLHDFDDRPIEGDDALQLARAIVDASRRGEGR